MYNDLGEGRDYDWGRLGLRWSEGGDILHADGTVLHTVGAGAATARAAEAAAPSAPPGSSV